MLDTPVLELLVEHILGILFRKFGEHFAIVSEVVNKSLKGDAVAIEEDLVVNLLELVHLREECCEF